MPRTLLISQQNGIRDPKPYGVKKVRINMKFSFLLCVVTVLFLGGCASADSRIINDLKYLEYLNDLDRRNVELDDIHKQWPFISIARNTDDDEERENIPERPDIDPERLMEAVNYARQEIANKHNQNIRDRLLETFEDGFKQHLKDTSDRGDHLSQYRRYKPLDQELLEEARMYPERNEEEEVKLNDDDSVYQNADILLDDEDEELTESRPTIHRPWFPRIAPVEKPNNYENAFSDIEDSEEENEEPERFVVPKPSYPKSLFPRIAPVDLFGNYKIDDLGFGSDNKEQEENHHHEHEEYKFKEGEEFPHTIDFETVPVAENPSEFGLKPTDPRFYRDAESKEEIVTPTPKAKSSIHPYLLTPHIVSKPKMNSRSENLPNDEIQLGSFNNKEVEVVPFKPDDEADTARVYMIAIIAGISAAATVGLIAFSIGWYNLQKHMKNAEDTDYPSYGIVGPNKDYDKKDRDDVGDRRLAQSAQMYHYQHQKQQIIAMGRNPQGHGSQTDSEEEEDEEGNYTVYECPGLASIEGPLEVKNPMFDDDQLATPSQTPLKPTKVDNNK